MSYRIQKMPEILNTVAWDNLGDKNSYAWHYDKSGKRHCFKCTLEDLFEYFELKTEKEHIICEHGLMAYYEANGFEAYASAYVPKYKQHMVVAMTTHGRLHNAFFGNPGKEAEKALTALLSTSGNIQTQTGNKMPIQVIKSVNGGKDEKDTRLACRVVFPRYDEEGKLIGYSTREYTYKCRSTHIKGDMVTVKVMKEDGDFELKVVKVVSCFITTEHEMTELAEKLGYKEIAELYCEEAIEL